MTNDPRTEYRRFIAELAEADRQAYNEAIRQALEILGGEVVAVRACDCIHNAEPRGGLPVSAVREPAPVVARKRGVAGRK